MRFGTMYSAGAMEPDIVVSRAIASGLDKHKFDTMVGTGLSGALVIPALAATLGRTWAIVRKQTDSHHSPYLIEGEIGKSWIFVDDLVSSGKTYFNVRKAVKSAFAGIYYTNGSGLAVDHHTRYVGSWLYRDSEWRKPGMSMGFYPKENRL